MEKGIIIQIQEMASDESVNVETLLRKAYVVAHKLHLNDFEEWIQWEQNGYPNSEKIPNYRVVKGRIKSFNPYYGWQLIVFPANIDETINSMNLAFPISSISDAYLNNRGSIRFTVGEEIITFLNDHTSGPPTNYCLEMSPTELKRVISTVCNKILEWTLILEDKGIIGRGLSFSDKEKEIAQQSTIINYTNNFFSTVTSSQIQQGSSGEQNNE